MHAKVWSAKIWALVAVNQGHLFWSPVVKPHRLSQWSLWVETHVGHSTVGLDVHLAPSFSHWKSSKSRGLPGCSAVLLWGRGVVVRVQPLLLTFHVVLLSLCSTGGCFSLRPGFWALTTLSYLQAVASKSLCEGDWDWEWPVSHVDAVTPVLMQLEGNVWDWQGLWWFVPRTLKVFFNLLT